MVFHISAFRILGILAVALAGYAKMKKSRDLRTRLSQFSPERCSRMLCMAISN